jgi:hypothetical protein
MTMVRKTVLKSEEFATDFLFKQRMINFTAILTFRVSENSFVPISSPLGKKDILSSSKIVCRGYLANSRYQQEALFSSDAIMNIRKLGSATKNYCQVGYSVT